MAKAPFATDPNVGDVAPVQIRGGFTPVDSNAVVAQVAESAKAVGTVIREDFERNLEKDIRESTKSLELALTARAFPKFADQLLAEHAKDDPIVQGAMTEMADISNAIKQGVLPHQYALQRLSVIKANAIEAAPEFADEISAAVQDVTGRDPDRAFFSELLTPATPTLSPEEKGRQAAEQELAKQVVLTGLSRETLVELGQQRTLADAEEASLKFQTTLGKRLSIGLERRTNIAVNNITQDTFQDMLQQLNTGGVIDPTTTSAAYSAQIDAKIAEMISDLPPGTPLSVLDDTINRMNITRDRMTRQINDGSLIKVITERKDLMVKGTQLGMMENSFEFATALALNPNDATRGLDLLVKMGESEFGKRLAGELNTTARVINETEDGRIKFFNFYSKLITNGEIDAPIPVSVEDKNIHKIATAEAMKSKDIQVQAKALEEMLTVHGEDFAWAALGSREVFLSVNPQTMGAAVENLQRSQTAALSTSFPAVANLPQFEVGRLKIQGNQLVYEAKPASFSRGDLPGLDNDITTWVDDFNRSAKISKMYADGGVINSALYGGIEQYLKAVTGDTFAAQQEAEGQRERNSPKTAPVRWERDANGIPRIVE